MMFKSIFKNEMEVYLSSYDNMAYYTKMHIREALFSFDNWLCENKLKDKSISQKIVDGWVIRISRNVASSTVYEKTLNINKFLTSLRSLGYNVCLAYLMKYKKARRLYVPYIFTDVEVKNLLYYIDNLSTLNGYDSHSIPLSYLYSPLIVRIMTYCGTRLGETLSIKINNINVDEGIILLKETKNKKERIIILHTKLLLMVRKYIKYLKLKDDDYLFPGRKPNTHISPCGIQVLFNKTLKSLGILKNNNEKHSRGPCLHCLRHYFVLKAFKQGVANGISVESQIPYLSYYLGHSSLNETEKYMKFSSELFPEEMEKFDDYSMDIFPEDI